MIITEANMIRNEFYQKTNPSEDDRFLFAEALDYLIHETKDPDYMVELGGMYYEQRRFTAEGIIKPKWKHELSLFHAVRSRYPDTLYQYRPDWLGRQSLDLYIPSIRTAIEYQGLQHFLPVAFFGGEEALVQRQELDQQKKRLCEENQIRLIEWPYTIDPTDRNVQELVMA